MYVCMHEDESNLVNALPPPLSRDTPVIIGVGEIIIRVHIQTHIIYIYLRIYICRLELIRRYMCVCTYFYGVFFIFF